MQIERCELQEVHVVFFKLSSDNTTDHVPNSRNTPQVHLRLMLKKNHSSAASGRISTLSAFCFEFAGYILLTVSEITYVEDFQQTAGGCFFFFSADRQQPL